MEKLDVAFIAPDLGGLVAAATLAAVGAGVVVFTDQTSAGAPITRAGALPGEFPHFTEPFLIRGLKPGPFLEPILNRMGILVQAKDYVHRADPPCQVCLPGVRFTLFTDNERFEDELRLEFGKNSRKVADFFQGMEELASQLDAVISSPEFPAAAGLRASAARLLKARPGTAELTSDAKRTRKPTLSEVYDQYNLDNNVRGAMNVLLMGLGLPPTADTPAAGAAQVLISARKGGIFRADLAELSSMILNVVKKRGGYIFPLSGLRGVNLSGNKITALTLTKATGVDAKLFVGSAKHLETLELNYTKKRPKSGAGTESAGKQWNEHKIEIVLDEEVIPVGMAERVVIYEPEPDIVVKLSLSKLFRADIEEGSGGTGVPEGERSVRIMRAVCTTPHHLPDPEKTMFNTLSNIIPFLRDYSYDGRYTKNLIGSPAYTPGGFLAVPEGQYSNLYPCGEELLMRMGLGAGIVSGKIISKLALKKLGLKADI